MVESVRQDEFTTHDPDEAHAWLREAYADLEIKSSRGADDFQFTCSSVTLEDLTIRMITDTMAVEIDFPYGLRRPSVFQQQALDGLTFTVAGNAVDMRQGDALMLPPGRACGVEWSGLSALTTTLSLDALRQIALDFVPGRADAFRIDFGRPLSAAARHHWSATTEYVLRVLTGNPLLANEPLARRELVGMVNSAVLACFPNSTMDVEIGPSPGDSPWALRRALVFIDEHAADPISLNEIAHAAGLSPRGLQASFRRNLHTTPLAYLRSVRMERAHCELIEAEPAGGASVAAVAARWGFTHLGRFATEYRRRYDLNPSQTLRARPPWAGSSSSESMAPSSRRGD
jgi:AraC-like DNA-binding protein